MLVFPRREQRLWACSSCHPPKNYRFIFFPFFVMCVSLQRTVYICRYRYTCEGEREGMRVRCELCTKQVLVCFGFFLAPASIPTNDRTSFFGMQFWVHFVVVVGVWVWGRMNTRSFRVECRAPTETEPENTARDPERGRGNNDDRR